MATAEPLVIPRLESLESTMTDFSYRQAIKSSSNYNARITADRKHRIPFLDTQTGIAQAPSTLYFDARQRLPGLKLGQIYSYPAKRWRKKRRQYLSNFTPAKRKDDSDSNDNNVPAFVENPSAVSSNNEDSKDSLGVKEQDSASKEAWYYDEMEMQEMDYLDEPEPESDCDYEDSYSVRIRKKKRPSGPASGTSRSSNRSSIVGEASPTSRRGGNRTSVGGVSGNPSILSKTPNNAGRGRRKAMTYVDLTDSDKPFACDLCGARYKTRPGLTYHYTHSHKEGTCADVVPRRGGDSSSSSSRMMNDEENSSSMDDGPPGSPAGKDKSGNSSGGEGWSKFQDSYLTFLNSPGAPTPGKKGAPPPPAGPPPAAGATGAKHPPGGTSSVPPSPTTPAAPSTSPTLFGSESKPHPMAPSPAKPSLPTPSSVSDDPPLPVLKMEQNEKPRAKPSPYCDFCLGDTINKKSGQPEDLVSCSDCGRSGHPTCLQFTNNMKVSVRKYRWQCIECKCCSICGTSDNDDQLLFCDDCDRGYHMYCLVPPIQTPPEGSWSCRLCIKEFHKK